jgi:predicted nucleic acid-binding protein
VTFFVDANVVLYANIPSKWREPCLRVIRAIASGDADGRISTAALEEVWHVELRGRAGALPGVTERAYAAFAPLLPVTDEIFARALALDATSVGTNDRLHAATCLENGIEVILSADAGLDAVEGLRRVDPLDREGVGELLS